MDESGHTGGENTEMNEPQFRCGYVAIAGAPNAGKSTLLNSLLGVKLSIVSSKPQTTRRRVLGFHTTGGHQIIFIDTPGLIDPSYELQRSMMVSARSAVRDADAVLLMFDASRLDPGRTGLSQRAQDILAHANRPAIAVLNKIDLIEKPEDEARLLDSLKAAYRFSSVLGISALHDRGLGELLAALTALLPVHPAYFPVDQLSDEPVRFFVSELIREQIFVLFHSEVPYATEVYIQEFKEDRTPVYIDAEIVVERASQRGILIGAKGSALREIGTRARKEIQAFLGRKVFLALHVRVREGWRDNDTWVRRFGYPGGTD
jgi:GTP-binding protein Era